MPLYAHMPLLINFTDCPTFVKLPVDFAQNPVKRKFSSEACHDYYCGKLQFGVRFVEIFFTNFKNTLPLTLD